MSPRSQPVQLTKNYRLFKRSDDNRSLDVTKHKKLHESMKLYGFLRCFPLACHRNPAKELIVKDGQHRLAFAEELGLTVAYIVEETDFDVAIINCTPKTWTLRDYAEKFSTHGKKAYGVGLEFAETHGLPIGTAFSLLGGTTTFSNIQQAFISGEFRIRDRAWADSVAAIYTTLVKMSPEIKNARLLEACMALCRVKEFNPDRLIQGAKRCRDKLVSYSTRDAYLDMLEAAYNYGRKQLVAVKVLAVQAMRARNPRPNRDK